MQSQIQTDFNGNFDQAESRAAAALQELEELAACACFSPTTLRLLLPQIKRSLSDFYNPLLSRSWTYRFALEDLKRLDELCGEE